MGETAILHVHYGTGKGKTTSAVGAVLRMTGHGKKALFCQFLKDGTSGEVATLKKLGVRCENPTKYLDIYENSFLFARVVNVYTKQDNYDIIVLDEVLDAVVGNAIMESCLVEFIDDCLVDNIELFITGHYHVPEIILRKAKYITYFDNKHHPYEDGIMAREGIEY